MTLYEKINSDMKEAMKSQDKDTLSTIRLLKSAIDLSRINNKLTEVTDELVIEVAARQVKQHKESIEEFRKASRNDLADNLEREIKIISNYFIFVNPLFRVLVLQHKTLRAYARSSFCSKISASLDFARY